MGCIHSQSTESVNAWCKSIEESEQRGARCHERQREKGADNCQKTERVKRFPRSHFYSSPKGGPGTAHNPTIRPLGFPSIIIKKRLDCDMIRTAAPTTARSPGNCGNSPILQKHASECIHFICYISTCFLPVDSHAVTTF